MKHSILMVMAGPNGSGKSTVTSHCKIYGEYVNADEICKYLPCSELEAAVIAEKTREYFLAKGESFTFETVLSTERNYNLMNRAKNAGYSVICVYVLTNDPEINVRRVRQRVECGGHDVPNDKIKARYLRAMRLFPKLFEVCTELYVYDNSRERGEGEPERIMSFVNGELRLYPNGIWTSDMLKKLCEGKYRSE